MAQYLDIPHHFTPRPYQIPFLRAVQASVDGESKIRNFMQIWHRRAGKDKTNIADTIPGRLIKDPCLVKFVYPTLVMGRENLWDGMGSDGFRYIEHLPEEIRAGKPNETVMKIPIRNELYNPDLNNASLFQVAGANKPDSLRGGNPKLVVFSEWSETDPYAWDVVEPILRENDGIAIFNMTPKGDNHARALMEYAVANMHSDNPTWHVEILTAEQTGIWSLQQLDAIREDIIKRFAANGRSEAEANAYFEQEYLCSFTSPVIGSYYGDGMRLAQSQGRITKVPYIEGIPVDTFWDLGMDDSMTIWFMQRVGQEFHFIDYYENSGEGFVHYARVLQERGYMYGKHYAPHDIAVRELGTGKSRQEVAKALGIKFDIGPKLSLDDGIDASRAVLRQCWFDAEKCHRGINCLKNYKKDWDEKNKVFKTEPKHDWASHGADSFRTFAVGFRRPVIVKGPGVYGGVQPFYPGIG